MTSNECCVVDKVTGKKRDAAIHEAILGEDRRDTIDLDDPKQVAARIAQRKRERDA